MSKKTENKNITVPEEDDGAVLTASADGFRLHCISIVGQIEGHYLLPESQKATKYEHIIPVLTEVEERNDIDGLLIVLNTMGGDVEAGLAISEMISGMSKPTVSLVLGGSHSIGVPLAVSAKKSFIVPTATMTLHPVRINGLIIGVPQSYEYFRRMQERIIGFITRNSKADKDVISSLIYNKSELANDVGTIIEGKEAVKIGLIDEIGSLHDAISCLKSMKNSKNT